MPEQTITPKRAASVRSWERDLKLQRLGFENYAAYMASPEWRDVRRRYKQSTRPQDCGLCGTSERIEIHHRTYERVGQEELADLAALCRDCHSMLHALERRGDVEGLDFDGLVDHARAEQNKRRFRERFELSDHELMAGNAQRKRHQLNVAGRLKNLVIDANKRDEDIAAEIEQVLEIVKAISVKLHGHE